MPESDLRLLLVDTDDEGSRKMGLALDAAGIAVGWSSFSPTELTQMVQGFHPQALLVHGELGSPQVRTLLETVQTLPVVLLCRDILDNVFAHAMRRGVVELLREPFAARAHIPKLRTALATLDERPGELKGRGSPKELDGVVAHVTRACRTGLLTVGKDGKVSFVRGALKSAERGGQAMQAALAAMVAAPAPWTFIEQDEDTVGIELGTMSGIVRNPEFVAPQPAAPPPPPPPQAHRRKFARPRAYTSGA